MNKIMRRVFIGFLFLIGSTSVYSQEVYWYLCLGSFHDVRGAENHSQLFTQAGLDTFISVYTEENQDVLYRVLLNEPYELAKLVHERRIELKYMPEVRSLGFIDFWCCKADPASAYIPPVVELPPEIMEQRTLQINDSDTGYPIADANVNIDKTWDVVTDFEGKAPIPPEIDDGEHTLLISKGEDYVPTETTVTIEESVVKTAPKIAIPKAVDYERIKIVLTWGNDPYDLDSHVIQGENHLYFSRMQVGDLELDIDDIDSYGPETVTIRNPDPSKRYSYFVHNYSDDYGVYETPMLRLSESNATVTVYFNNEFKKSFTVKPNQDGINWYVFDIEGNEIVPVDIVFNDKVTQ